jgi:hypothetical protein
VFEKDPTPEGACTSPVGVLEGGRGLIISHENMAHLVAEIFRYHAGDRYVRPELEFPAGQAPYRGKRHLSRTRGIMKVAWFGVIAFLNAPQAMVTERSRMQVVAVAHSEEAGNGGRDLQRHVIHLDPRRWLRPGRPRSIATDQPLFGTLPPAPSACMLRIRFVGK